MRIRPKDKGLLSLEGKKGQFSQLEKRISELHQENDRLREDMKVRMNTLYDLEGQLKEVKDK